MLRVMINVLKVIIASFISALIEIMTIIMINGPNMVNNTNIIMKKNSYN